MPGLSSRRRRTAVGAQAALKGAQPPGFPRRYIVASARGSRFFRTGPPRREKSASRGSVAVERTRAHLTGLPRRGSRLLVSILRRAQRREREDFHGRITHLAPWERERERDDYSDRVFPFDFAPLYMSALARRAYGRQFFRFNAINCTLLAVRESCRMLRILAM